MPIRSIPAVATAATLMAAAIVAACRQPEAAAAPAPSSSATSAASAVPASPVTAGQVPAPIAAVLDDIKRGDTAQLAVSPEDGQFLRMLVASTGRKRALEIGAAQGYSAIWIG